MNYIALNMTVRQVEDYHEALNTFLTDRNAMTEDDVDALSELCDRLEIKLEKFRDHASDVEASY